MRKSLFRIVLYAVALLLWISLSLASAPPASKEGSPSWGEHLDVVNVIIGFLFLALVSVVVWLIKKIDTNQGIIFDRLTKLSNEFYELQGEHKALKGKCGQ
jgi:hypothetical protein